MGIADAGHGALDGRLGAFEAGMPDHPARFDFSRVPDFVDPQPALRRLDAELDADTLIAWCRQNMAPYKTPREVRFIDTLPATGAGKVLRRLLKDIE